MALANCSPEDCDNLIPDISLCPANQVCNKIRGVILKANTTSIKPARQRLICFFEFNIICYYVANIRVYLKSIKELIEGYYNFAGKNTLLPLLSKATVVR